MSFERTILIESPTRSLKIEKKSNEPPEYDYERQRAKSVQALTAKKTLGTLYLNFRRVFPNSVFDRLRMLTFDVTGQETLILRIISQIMSSTGNYAYQSYIVLRREKETDRWSLGQKCEIKCECPAFKYWLAYPDLINRNFYGKPSKWNYVKNKKLNIKLIPGMCKHTAFLVSTLISQGIIKP